MLESASDIASSVKREPDENEPKAVAVPAQPSLPVRARQRPMKLSEMTKPLSSKENANLAKAALGRLLKAERTAMLGGVAALRQKILASLVTLFAEDFRERKNSFPIHKKEIRSYIIYFFCSPCRVHYDGSSCENRACVLVALR